jgi:hypothetical protein
VFLSNVPVGIVSLPASLCPRRSTGGGGGQAGALAAVLSYLDAFWLVGA